MAVYVGIATVAVAIIVGIPTLVLTVALFRVSELGADVRAITPRIDQTIPGLINKRTRSG
jgi:hypothetical protein